MPADVHQAGGAGAAGAAPVPARSPWRILGAVGFGGFLTPFEGSLVSVGLPVLSRTFMTDLQTIAWVIIAYMLTVSGLMLLFGRLGDLIGHRRLYRLGFVCFSLGSLLCGMASSVLALIAFRMVQGVGGAMLMAVGPALITRSFPAHRRGQALGTYVGIVYVGLTVGPLAGGLVTELLGWRWIFLINLPVGVAGYVMSTLLLAPEHPGGGKHRFDVAGALAFIVALTALLLALYRGRAWGWGSPLILLLLALAVGAGVVFLRLEASRPEPMLDLNLFRSRLFAAATASALFNYLCMYSVVVLTPFYLIQLRGFTPSRAGILLTAMPLIMVVMAPLSGWLSDRIGSRIPASLGMASQGVGALLLSGLTPASTTGEIVLGLGCMGLGAGLFSSPNNSALMGAAPRERQGVAAGIVATARHTGMVLGTAITGALFSGRLERYRQLLQAEPQAFTGAFHDALLAIALVAGLGVITSLVRGRTHPAWPDLTQAGGSAGAPRGGRGRPG
ncbi:MAG: MFS transporter [Deltaproteobacteria bacterium]|nr:MFS transporter [Deltaproteobacteria bacterium]